MFGLSCNKDHHLPKGISPGVQARESLGGKPSPRGRGCIHDPGVLILRGVILLGHSNRSRCFSGALLDLALASLGILALGARCLQCGVGGGGAVRVIPVGESVAWRGPLFQIAAGVTPAPSVFCLWLLRDAW